MDVKYDMNVTDKPAVILFRLQLLFSVTHSQQMSLVDVQRHDLLKQLIQSLSSTTNINTHVVIILSIT